MIRALLKSRGWRKFRKNRMAMASSVVILIYTLIALAVWGGVLTRADTKERVLPNRAYGFLEKPNLEERYNDAVWFVRDHLAPVLDRAGGLSSAPDPKDLLEPLALAERTVEDAPPAQIDADWATLKASYEEMDTAWLDHLDLKYEVDDLRVIIAEEKAEPEPDEEEIGELQAELDELEEELRPIDAEVLSLLDEVEAGIRKLMPMPTGWKGFVYKFRTFLGSDYSGRSISVQAFYSIKIAFQVGLVVALVSVIIGTLLGAASGFYGGWVDNVVMWLVSTLSSIPYLVLLAVVIFAFQGHKYFDNPAEYPGLQLVKIYVAMISVFWVSTCRVIRGEVMKIKELEYVQAATAIGFGRFYILLKHVIPNTAHLMFINFSLLFIGAIKGEVILSFLGLGVTGQPSWGVMISLGREDVQNFFFWTVMSATVLMFILVLAFNIVSDALQDAFDPKAV